MSYLLNTSFNLKVTIVETLDDAIKESKRMKVEDNRHRHDPKKIALVKL